MRRFIIPVIMTIVLSLVTYFATRGITVTPPLATLEGVATDKLLHLLFIIAEIIFWLVVSFMVYSVIAFRRRPGDMTDAAPNYGNVRLEIAWTLAPFALLMGLAGYGAVLQINATPAFAAQHLRVEVTGRQWSWSFKYPDYNINSSELYLPVNEPVDFSITSVDVIHSFWIPEFRFKMDANPGIINRLVLTPDRIGDYQVMCAELCGTAHAVMTAPVHVVSAANFQTWVSQQQAAAQGAGGAALGAQLAQQEGCTGCHSTNGTVLVGPTWKGLFGSQVTLSDGTTVTADDAYVHRSIVDPSAQIVKGFPDVMPKNYGSTLNDAQIQALIDYIKSLQ